jgi:hypothetical protein
MRETARLGLTKSRYPIDLGQGPTVDLPHLGPLRALARHMVLDSWVASIERRPEDAVNDILDTFVVADSLADEPLAVSQMVRVALDALAVTGLETSLNRTEFTGDQLARLQEGFERALPPLSKGPFMNRGMGGEASLFLYYESYLRSVEVNRGMREGFFDRMTTREGAGILRNLFAGDLLTAALYAGWFRTLQGTAEKAMETGCVPDPHPAERWTENRLLFFRAPMFAMAASGNSHLYETEWRLRTQFDMARAALAA